MNTTTSIILDTRRAKQDGTFPVKLRVTHQRKQKYFAIGISLSQTDFDKAQGEKPRGEYKDLKIKFGSLEARAIKVIEKLPEFSFEAFEKRFLEKKQSGQDVYSYYDRYIDSLKQEGRVGTASSYQTSLNSLKSFHPKKLSFAKVNAEFLLAYERWMLSRGNSQTSVGIYLRTLRALFNLAIEEGVLDKKDYPFGKRKYQIPAGRNIKKALTLEDIQKIFDYQPVSESEAWSRDLWLFSYLCNGINVKDIARLKYRNIEGDKITFIRAKTERTAKKNLKPVVAILTPEAKEILERWGLKPRHAETYVFGILTNSVTPEREMKLVQQAVKNINKYIKRIAVALGIEKEVTTYTARHSFSTILKRSGAPIEFISESLGHQDLKTTEYYLDSFEDDVKKQYAGLLTNFKKSH
ncbi:site-specific integrase [Nafulsella turpanensis]|uniref:site-specific integrase n=1 Tax=Nafulsella turpanensis TaxID=1265690 RepID=UPI0004755E6B|nr:site-specific integrase [Nafulsella turpanensis]